MSVELWKSIFDWVTVVLIALTVFSGAGALITGNIIGKRQDARLRQFDQDLTDAKTTLGKQQKLTAELEHENLMLQEKLANRRITPEQHRILVDFLTKKPGTIIIETMSDSESGLFAADFLKTFIDAKWQIGGKHFPLGVVWTGLIVYDSLDPNAVAVAEALKAAKIPFSIGTERREKATIMVGGKPPMF